ncbi:MAG: hypothetical protein QM501_02055 [Gimesia sp.]
MARKSKGKLPRAGDAFAFPLEDGRFSVCRVLADRIIRPKIGIDSVLVACSAWIGTNVPREDDPELKQILNLTHHTCDEQYHIVWIDDPVPDTFIPIGSIEPTEEEIFTNCPSYCGWTVMALQPLRQWRWDHERDAVLVEDAAQEKANASQAVQENLRHQRKLKRAKLEKLAKHTFFPKWNYPSKKAITASRKLMDDTVRELIKLGKSASESDRLQVLQSCIESFNQLDEKWEFIETVEREDICREFEAIVYACGLGSYESLADEWRDW